LTDTRSLSRMPSLPSRAGVGPFPPPFFSLCVFPTSAQPPRFRILSGDRFRFSPADSSGPSDALQTLQPRHLPTPSASSRRIISLTSSRGSLLLFSPPPRLGNSLRQRGRQDSCDPPPSPGPTSTRATRFFFTTPPYPFFSMKNPEMLSSRVGPPLRISFL